ncbi:two-component system, OmpR family, phosphate regulon response regulator PhoB/two-component system, OmpR family, response regulator ArlR [Desulfurobacterium pacificum]|uniref:Two-component system, OmpR family, phosphate regulon response regulator PhoB/two-component system, OmpR family, response regulator ArlR n=1 Tax=Desulfurobacterium pacificum TaxID=240166 RepID=A0ABY1NUT8_9BACT|nr:response regulator transcription factor [Desulfurobacterium pacificum]SMP18867.1 two-component system, OmpR family, phosphate regulon response regulator PhoB/two-component system, OmpR family, response regulator ArlR [Desulfurobacterium pacificum]
MRALVVEDDKSLAKEIKNVFTDYGLGVEVISSREEIINRNNYSILILDVALLGAKGYDICKEVKEKKGLPVIVLCSIPETDFKIRWFEIGADDVIIKPFSTKELLARTMAILRRYKDKINNILEFEGITLKKKEGRIIIDGKSIDLTKIELEILELLIKYQEEVLPKDFLLNRIWGTRKSARTLDVYIHRLRKKLGSKGKHIKTLTNVGYILTRNV